MATPVGIEPTSVYAQRGNAPRTWAITLAVTVALQRVSGAHTDAKPKVKGKHAAKRSQDRTIDLLLTLSSALLKNERKSNLRVAPIRCSGELDTAEMLVDGSHDLLPQPLSRSAIIDFIRVHHERVRDRFNARHLARGA